MLGLGSTASIDDTLQASSRLESDTVVIVPAYREAGAISQVVTEIRKALDPLVLVVNRPANDGTEALAMNSGAIVIPQAGKGKGDAVELGLEYVRRNLAEVRYIGFVDADCTYPANPLNSMRRILESVPSVGMVTGRREKLKNNGFKSEAFAVGNQILGGVHHLLNKVPLRDPLSGLRMVRADLLRTWKPKSKGFDIECELNCYVHNEKQLDIVEIPVEYRARVGQKKLGFRHGFQILARMIQLSFQHLRPHKSPQPHARSVGAPRQQ